MIGIATDRICLSVFCLCVRLSHAGSDLGLKLIGLIVRSRSFHPGTLVFLDQFSYPRSQGNPLVKVSNKIGAG